MASKYDEFWRAHLPQLRRAIAQVAGGDVVRMDVAGVAAFGERQSWYGSAIVRGTEIVRAEMAHVRALARLLVEEGVTTPHPDTTFRLVVGSSLTLEITAAATRATLGATGRRRASQPARPARRPPSTAARTPGDRVPPSEACARLHALLLSLPRHVQPDQVPFNDGIYFFFERDEDSAHGPGGRVVRIGTHRVDGVFRSRLAQHYHTGTGAKNASVFRRYLGGALLRRRDPGNRCLRPAPGHGHWEHQDGRACPRCETLEGEVSQLLGEAFGFTCVPVGDRDERRHLEARLIATVAACERCRPSTGWLGHAAYPAPVRASGLWNRQHVGGPTATTADLARLEVAVGEARRGVPHDGSLEDTLLLIPCCKSKQGTADPGLPRRRLADDLGAEARTVLLEGRGKAFARPGTELDETSPLRPAIATYTGQPFTTPGVRAALTEAVGRGLHCLVISGGYGVVRVEEPIHAYEAHLQRTMPVWRARVPVVLRDYVARHGIRRSFGTFSRGYAAVVPDDLTGRDWRRVPTWDGRGSPMVEVPKAVGRALAGVLERCCGSSRR